MIITGSNQRLGNAFDYLDPRLSLFVMSSAPAKKSAGDARCASQDPLTHDKSHKISTQIRTSSNQRLGSAFDDLDPRLSLFVMSFAPTKISAGDARCASQDPSTHDKSHKTSTQIRIRKRSSYVERN